MNWLYQCKFEILRQARNRRFIIFSLLMPVGYYFLFTYIYGNQKIENVQFQIYYLISMGAFSVVGGALNGLSGRIAFERTGGWLRIIQTTPLRSISYINCKTAAQLFVNASMVLILFMAARFIKGVHLSPWEWCACFLWLTIGSLPFIVLGMLIGLVADIEAAQIISSVVYFVISIGGGLWLPIELFAGWMKDIAQAMPTYRLASVCWSIVAGKAPPVLDFSIMTIYLIAFTSMAIIVLNRARELNA